MRPRSTCRERNTNNCCNCNCNPAVWPQWTWAENWGALPLFWGRGAGSPSNTMRPRSRPICKPSSILIHPTVRPQYTNVTDRQDRTDGQDLIWRSASAQATLCSMGTTQISPEKSAQPHPIFGPCLLWPNGWMDQDTTLYGGKPRPRRRCVRWGRSSPTKTGIAPILVHVYCGQTLDG